MTFLQRTPASHLLYVGGLASVLAGVCWLWMASAGAVAADGPWPSHGFSLPQLAGGKAAASFDPTANYPRTSALRYVSLRGSAQALSGDTLLIGQQRVRLFGIQAADNTLLCADDRGESLATGATSVYSLAQLVHGRTVACEVLGGRAPGEVVAYCEAGAMDLAGRQVDSGWARNDDARTDLYRMPEARAHQERLGVWACNHLRPSAFRAGAPDLKGS